jgi:predicted RNA-binding protein with PIN domain
MHYYIDGYNLLFRFLKAGEAMQKQREDITLDIERMLGVLNIDATLVFDSHYQEDENTRSHFKSLEIIFTSKGETADEYILQELKESHSPANHTVVTSDKKLAHLCQLRLGKTLSVDEFLNWIRKRYKNKLKRLQNPKPLETLRPLPITPKKEELPALLSSTTAAAGCFDYYLDTFEKEVQKLEKEAPPPPKPATPPKKIKVKKRQLSKEEMDLSSYERWKKNFENPAKDPDDNFF